MEEELRYYYGFDKYETLIEKLKMYAEDIQEDSEVLFLSIMNKNKKIILIFHLFFFSLFHIIFFFFLLIIFIFYLNFLFFIQGAKYLLPKYLFILYHKTSLT